MTFGSWQMFREYQVSPQNSPKRPKSWASFGISWDVHGRRLKLTANDGDRTVWSRLILSWFLSLMNNLSVQARRGAIHSLIYMYNTLIGIMDYTFHQASLKTVGFAMKSLTCRLVIVTLRNFNSHSSFLVCPLNVQWDDWRVFPLYFSWLSVALRLIAPDVCLCELIHCNDHT